MKTKNIILIGGASAIGVVAYLYFNKKNKAIDALPTIAPSKIADSLVLPESSAIKASDVVIPSTAVVLPTASSVVQSSAIQEEDINSLDCASLMLKYNAVNKQFESLATTEGSNSSNVALLRNRIALIKNVMSNKNCVIDDPVLESAIIEQKIIAPTKYTNAEISQIASTSVTDLINENYSNPYTNYAKLFSPAIRGIYNIKTGFKNTSYVMTTKLEDFLKTLNTKADVDRFVIIYPTLGKIKSELYQADQKTKGYPFSVDNSERFEEAKSNLISNLDSEFLNKIGFKPDYVF